uniref:C2H2-type domain-containing protein n=2 Tax=Trichobilharzia regenti TaxID=157069 RepID=A0AA85JMN3_TRIRE|nr:unnamed protein product [Trichobilharzia regenti]
MTPQIHTTATTTAAAMQSTVTQSKILPVPTLSHANLSYKANDSPHNNPSSSKPSYTINGIQGIVETTKSQDVLKSNAVSPQFPKYDYSKDDENNSGNGISSRMNGEINMTRSTTDSHLTNNIQQNMSTEELFLEEFPSAQSSYLEESIVNNNNNSNNGMSQSVFDTSPTNFSKMDNIHSSAIANAEHINNRKSTKTDYMNENGNITNQIIPCCQIELGQPMTSPHPNTTISSHLEEQTSLEISSETQRAMESSNSTPPSTENVDSHCQEKVQLLLSSSSPTTHHESMNDSLTSSDWIKHKQLNNEKTEQTNYQIDEQQNSSTFAKTSNEHVFLDYTDENSTVLQSPNDFTDDQTGHSMASSDDAQSTADESDEGMSLANFEHYTNSMQPNHAGLYFCHLCDFTGGSRQEFQDHLRSHYDYKCLKCDYTSRTEGRLKRHLKDFHSDIPPENFSGKTIKSIRPKLQRCKQCDYVTDTKEEFWRHLRIHIKEDKRLECHLCCFITEYKHHLEYHMRNHIGSKPYKCTKCNYECVNKSMLNSHMKSHSNIYPYRCGNCNYATKYCHSLKLHLSKHEHRPAVVLNPDGSLPQYDNTIEVMNIKRGPSISKHANLKLNVKHFNSSESTRHKLKGSSSSKSTLKYSSAHQCINSNKNECQGESMTTAPVSESTSQYPTYVNTEFPNSALNTSANLFPAYTGSNHPPNDHMEPVMPMISQSVSVAQPLNNEINSNHSHLITNYASNSNECLSDGIVTGQCMSMNQDPLLNYSVSAYSSVVAFMAAMQCNDFNRNRLLSSDQSDRVNFMISNPTICSSDSLKLSNESHTEISSNQLESPSLSSQCKEHSIFNEMSNNYSPTTTLPTNSQVNTNVSKLQNDQIRAPTMPTLSSTTPTILTTLNQNRLQTEKDALMEKQYSEEGMTTAPHHSLNDSHELALDLSSASCHKKNMHVDKFLLHAFESNEKIPQAIPKILQSDEVCNKKWPTITKFSTSPMDVSHSPASSSNNNNSHKDKLDFTYECRFCEIRFRQRTLYDIHMGYHSHSDPYLCNRCGHQSRDSVEFFIHLGQEAHYS